MIVTFIARKKTAQGGLNQFLNQLNINAFQKRSKRT